MNTFMNALQEYICNKMLKFTCLTYLNTWSKYTVYEHAVFHKILFLQMFTIFIDIKKELKQQL